MEDEIDAVSFGILLDARRYKLDHGEGVAGAAERSVFSAGSTIVDSP